MTSRLQLALNVDNLEEAVNYYSQLFEARPHKIRNAYANFAIDNPPLKLVLFENPKASERLHHLGVEGFKEEQVDAAKKRLSDANLLTEAQSNETCCHATQDKIWSRDPQGMPWEWYRITDDTPEAHAPGACFTDKRTHTRCCC